MVNEWLATRSPPPPARLAVRLAAATPPSEESVSSDLSESLIAAAAAILRDTITDSADGRNGAAALDLLAADALITYAVEAAAEDCKNFPGRTDEMIARLSAVAGYSDPNASK